MSKAINMRLIQEVARMTAEVFKEKNAIREAITIISKDDVNKALSKVDKDGNSVLDSLDKLRTQVQNGEILSLTFTTTTKGDQTTNAQVFSWRTHSLMLGFDLLNSLRLCTDIAERISEITGYKPENLEEELQASLAQRLEQPTNNRWIIGF